MSLKDTIKHMHDLLDNIKSDLQKAEGGNKAAAQRVRTGTVKMEKVAKVYRKESIQAEKKGAHQSPRKPAQKSHKPAKAKKAAAKPKNAHKSKSVKASARPRALLMKRATAKIPLKK